MSEVSNNSALSEEDRARFETAIRSFEEAWHTEGEVRIEKYLPAEEPLRTRILVELVAIDAEFRHQRGKPMTKEDYWRLFPELAAGVTIDRNLLFGILAVQLDFVSRDQWLTAMNIWSRDKAALLVELLERTGALTRTDRDRLEPLVEQHIRQHGNDPHKSLAALSSLGSLKADLARLTDDQIAATLSVIGSGSRTPTTSFAAGPPGSDGSRYRVLRPHAQGGLGKVFVARDKELNREVALKEIRQEYADDPSARARFTLEAEVTGGLEHPGIVPVYGLGAPFCWWKIRIRIGAG